MAAAGHTAKQVVDLRIALEAKRLLVHSGATVAQIGHRLGFSEATNFVKFFRRLAGVTPLEFRAAHAPHEQRSDQSKPKRLARSRRPAA